MIYSIRVHFTLCRHFYSMLMYRFTEAVFTFKAHAHKAKLEIIKKIKFFLSIKSKIIFLKHLSLNYQRNSTALIPCRPENTMKKSKTI